jgi:hypothetical protein
MMKWEDPRRVPNGTAKSWQKRHANESAEIGGRERRISTPTDQICSDLGQGRRRIKRMIFAGEGRSQKIKRARDAGALSLSRGSVAAVGATDHGTGPLVNTA